MNAKEKLNALERSAKFNAENWEPVTVASTKEILAIAAEFRALTQENILLKQGCENDPAVHEMLDWKERAEAAEAKLAELEKQEPVAVVARRDPTLLWEWTKQGKSIDTPDGMHLYARPAPAVSMEELVPDEMVVEPFSRPVDAQKALESRAEGFNLCRAAILRNIEEAK